MSSAVFSWYFKDFITVIFTQPVYNLKKLWKNNILACDLFYLYYTLFLYNFTYTIHISQIAP